MSEPQPKKRTKNRGNATQMNLLRNFMAANPAFANNEVDNKVYWATWESLTQKLNAKGTVRNFKAWEKTWADQLRKGKPTVEDIDQDIPETTPHNESNCSGYKMCSTPPREKSTRSPPKMSRSPPHDRSRPTLQCHTKREESRSSPYQIRERERDRSSRSPYRYERPRTPQQHRSSRSPYEYKRPRTPQQHRSSRSPYQYKRPRTSQERLSRSPYKNNRSPQRNRLSKSPCRISSPSINIPTTPPRNGSRAATCKGPESSARMPVAAAKTDKKTSAGQTLTNKTTTGNHHRGDGIIDLTDDEVRLDAKQRTRTAKPLGPSSHAVIQFMKDNSKDNERIVGDVMNVLKTQNEILTRGLASITQAITDWKPEKTNAVVESDAEMHENRNLGLKDEERKGEEYEEEESEDEPNSDQYETEYLEDDFLMPYVPKNHTNRREDDDKWSASETN